MMRNILSAKQAQDNDCRCEKYENVELFLGAIKQKLLKANFNISSKCY